MFILIILYQKYLSRKWQKIGGSIKLANNFGRKDILSLVDKLSRKIPIWGQRKKLSFEFYGRHWRWHCRIPSEICGLEQSNFSRFKNSSSKILSYLNLTLASEGLSCWYKESTLYIYNYIYIYIYIYTDIQINLCESIEIT